ncbi:MAG: hypothetical protein BWY64_02929 [bacterium ADurb.Bin363]|nr:MAG: hypothetical protein BWY64_02929 [bacterium ADurb.Bin363]
MLKVRDIQGGELWINFAALRVYRIYDKLPVEKPVWLLIREDLDGNDIKFTFSNAKARVFVLSGLRLRGGMKKITLHRWYNLM